MNWKEHLLELEQTLSSKVPVAIDANELAEEDFKPSSDVPLSMEYLKSNKDILFPIWGNQESLNFSGLDGFCIAALKVAFTNIDRSIIYPNVQTES